MHSRVFEIFPLDEVVEDGGYGEDLPEWWYQSECDYYNEITDNACKKDALEWLAFDEEVVGNAVVFGKKCLERRWKEFKKLLEKLMTVTKEEFLGENGDVDFDMYKLKEAHNRRTEFWFFWDDEMYTLSEMERRGGAFRIGRIWDYHF